MAGHFNWLGLAVSHEYVHVATLGLSSTLLVLVAARARQTLGTGDEAVAPDNKVSVRSVLETIVEFIVGMADLVIGHDGRKFAPMFATIFLMILFNNLLGLVPGMTPATENINTTFALGIFSFAIYNFYGIKENGLGYLKHFFGPVWWLGPFMLAVEIISHAIRPLSLSLRLMGNLQGDHAVLSAFLELCPFGVPAIFYFMGAFVCFMQAFVFTVLSMVYVSMATAHDH